MSEKFSRIFFNAILLLCAAFVHGQTPVGMAPPIHFQFLNNAGQPLAGGKIWTYQAGTTTLQNTYADGGGVNLNPDPIPLDATGSPSNGSVQTGIFLSNASWKFVAFDVNNVFQWQVDNVTTYFALLNSTNTWSATQTFAAQIIDTLADNQIVLGAGGNQTTLDFPPPVSGVTLHFPNTADTIVGRATTDTLTNKSLTQPVINGVIEVNPPATYVSIGNAAPGTGAGLLAKMSGTNPVTATTADTGGVIGLCVAGCSTTGSSTIQQNGVASCVFDGATSGGDYVQISSTVAGDCHDTGSTSYPASGQVIGRSLQSFGIGGTYFVDLFSPESRPTTLYDTNGNALGPAKFIKGSATLSAGTVVVTFTGASVFSNVLCTANDTTGANAVQLTIPDTAHLHLNGTGSDVIFFICVGY